MPLKKDSNKRISRLRLTLPLSSSPYHGSFAVGSDDEEQKLVSATGSEWTLSAAPASTASAYSQESYTLSPVPFRSAKVDKRRFALAIGSANWEGQWSAPIRTAQSPDAATFVLDLHSATLEPEEQDITDNYSAETLLKKVDDEEDEKFAKVVEEKPDHSLKETKKEIVSKEATQAKAQKPRAKSVFGKFFSRRSTRPTPQALHAASDEEEDRPLLPSLPPRIEVTLPSPGIKGVHDLPETDITPADLVRSLQSANIPGNRATMPSGWKLHRPPSPLPKMLKKNKNGYKRVAASSALPMAQSPVPPMPNLPKDEASSFSANPVSESECAEDADKVAPLVQTSKSRRRTSWTDSFLQVTVKTRAMQSAYYAPVPEDVLSPPSSAM